MYFKWAQDIKMANGIPVPPSKVSDSTLAFNVGFEGVPVILMRQFLLCEVLRCWWTQDSYESLTLEFWQLKDTFSTALSDEILAISNNMFVFQTNGKMFVWPIFWIRLRFISSTDPIKFLLQNCQLLLSLPVIVFYS